MNEIASQYLLDTALTVSKELETEGFDLESGKTWIYPTNYPLRDYQYSIIQEALLKNTLVSLPTGLGKTFIAAVVMFNFYRWYPRGKIIFMAPTKPLVKQQADACYNIMAIPKEVTVELTGTKMQAARKNVWLEKRVFFITPQVLQNDLDILVEFGKSIKCLVFDEAHKARGNYAYCQVIRKLRSQNSFFRVLALSATPGNNQNDVLEVVNNLMISHIEIRGDDSPDVTPYIFERCIETIVVPLGEKLQQIKNEYLMVLEKYNRILRQYNVFTGNCGNLTKGKIFMIMKEFQQRSRNGRNRAHSDIMRNLNIAVTLYHAYELLIRHGLRGFLTFFEEHLEKPLLKGNLILQKLVADIANYLGPTPNIEPLPDGSVAEIPKETKFGHPKFYKLGEIVLDHFETSERNSRVIVFCEYKESVMEAYAHLLRLRPRVTPKIFVGQGSITQRQQVRVIEAFKNGECNTLISTSIGEEGLDVGDVDLIVCFDIHNKSPVRMVQRIGRTGRKRRGRVVILVTEGKEQQTLRECLAQRHNLQNFVLKSGDMQYGMYQHNPRMIPENLHPICQKVFITVNKKEVAAKLPQKRAVTSHLKDLLNNMSATQKDRQKFLVDRIPKCKEFWNKNLKEITDAKLRSDNRIDFSLRIDKMRSLQRTGLIGHSKDSETLAKLLGMPESKKSITQITETIIIENTEDDKKSGLKQWDLKEMFTKISSNNDFPIESDSSDSEIDEVLEMFQKSLNSKKEILENSTSINCVVCNSGFKCVHVLIKPNQSNTFNWNLPDESILNSINEESLRKYCNSFKELGRTPEKLHETKNLEWQNFDSDTELKQNTTKSVEKPEILGDLKPEKQETPKENVQVELSIDNIIDFEAFGFDSVLQDENNVINQENNEDLIDEEINEDEDFFEDSQASFEPCSNVSNILNKCGLSSFLNDSSLNSEKKSDGSLNFFGLNTLEDLFSPTPQVNEFEKSPGKKAEEIAGDSPILCSLERSMNIRNKVQRKLFRDEQADNSIDLFSDSFNISNEKTILKTPVKETVKEISNSDFFDASFFDFSTATEKHDETNTNSTLLSVTQMISFINKDSGKKEARKKPNCSATKNKLSLLNKKADEIEVEEEELRKSPILPLSRELNVTLRDFARGFELKNSSKRCNVEIESSSEEEFKEPKCIKSKLALRSPHVKPKKKSKKKEKPVRNFFEMEADVSSDCIIISEDENESNDDCFEQSFVDDNTQNIANCTMVHAQYLKSVASPILKRGKFKIPTGPFRNTNIFSQVDTCVEGENNYMDDTFCVDEEIEPSQDQQLSELEIAEMILEKRRKARKKVPHIESKEPKRKRRRIVISSDSD